MIRIPRLPKLPSLVVASTNPGKILEVRLALCGLSGWMIDPLPPGTPDIEETGKTFAENAAIKAIHYSQFTGCLTLADDSGLCVKALDNRPGIFSGRYAPTAEARNQRLLDELAALDNPAREASFFCAFALAEQGSLVWKVQTKLRGEIVRQPAGEFGFGYDPVFYVPELAKTLAELSTEEKNRISARGQALKRLAAKLVS